MFSSFHFNDTQDDYDPLIWYGKEAVVTKYQQDPWFYMEDSEFMDLFSSVYGSRQEKTVGPKTELIPSHQPDDCEHNDFQSQVSEQGKPLKDKALPFSSASLQLLANYERGFNKTRGAFSDLSNDNNVVGQKLTMEEILRMAGERFIQFSTNKEDVTSMSISCSPFPPDLSS
ncbi:unnamed protein product [Fraxinus pennsylvanica]|uniref:Uncharacterized protein n=1 Tax=Fraxinus pennsylvanica TaxID=56036 RepID=A0AAD2EAY7_9LAMI|nr:unnamed protein product [Fraxinus pennsylvanica]